MSRFSLPRPAALGLSAAGLLLVTALLAPTRVRALGLDVWNLPQVERELQTAQQEEHRLDVERVDTLDEEELTRVRINDLIAGRVELAAAARERWETRQFRTGYRRHLESYPRDAGGEARSAHNLIELACDLCPAAAHAAVHDRLSREYERAYGQPMPAN